MLRLKRTIVNYLPITGFKAVRPQLGIHILHSYM